MFRALARSRTGFGLSRRVAPLIAGGGSSSGSSSGPVDAEAEEINSTTVNVDTFADTDGVACIWDYAAWNGANARVGRIYARWDATGNVIGKEEEHTADLGNTADLTFEVVIAADEVQLQAIAASDGWNVSAKRTLLGG